MRRRFESRCRLYKTSELFIIILLLFIRDGGTSLSVSITQTIGLSSRNGPGAL